MSAFDDFLADVAAERRWLLELDPLPLLPESDGSAASGAYADAAYSEVAYGEGESGDSATLYYSSHGFTSQPADVPASTWYENRVQGVRISRAIFSESGGVGGLARTTGECHLVNADGELDELQDSYALDGRPARLLLGGPAAARSAYGLVFSGVVQKFDDADVRLVRFALSDGIGKLAVPVSPNTYAGTGALEGGADLAGKPKPKAWGNAQNVAPPLVDSTKLIYQVHEGQISDVTSVYDRGIALVKGADYASQAELEATAPAAGQYRVWKTGGHFRLGATPAGTVTADVLGDAAGGYVNKTADILKRVLLIAAIDDSLIDAASFAALNVDAPAEVGIWVGAERRAVGELVGRLLAGVGAYGGFSRANLFTVGVVKAASGVALDSFSEEDIGEIRRLPLPAAVEPVVWRAHVAWQRNYTVQTDLAAGVTAARRVFAAEAERVASREDQTVRSQRQLALEYGPTGNLYAQQADADAEALRLLNLWKPARGLYLLPVLAARALARELGDVVKVTHRRYGFDAGKDVRILGVAITGARADLTVLA